jgi:hypothetical protein
VYKSKGDRNRKHTPRTKEKLVTPGVTNPALRKFLRAGIGEVAGEAVVAEIRHGQTRRNAGAVCRRSGGGGS